MLRLASILISAGLLAACSTNDILTLDDTPPAPVGSGAATTAASMQSAPPVAAAPAQNVARQSLAPPSAPPSANTTATSQTSFDATPGQGRAPSTFGAQAAGMSAQAQQAVEVSKTVATAPASSTPAVVTPPPAKTAPAPATQSAPIAKQQAAPAPSAITSAETVRFLPIIGAPSDKLKPLSLRLGDSARASGLSIAQMDDDAADISLKGYFSAINQDGVVSVIYVWDVLGKNGQRLHRIQGNEPAVGDGFTGNDPWNGVSDTMMASIGQKTVGDLLAWLDTQS